MINEALFLNGKYLGSREYTIPPERQGFPTPNRIYICPECGEVWAKIIYTSPDNQKFKNFYAAYGYPCEAHGGGSIISSYNKALNASLPRTRDFLLHELNIFEKKKDRYWFDGFSQTA